MTRAELDSLTVVRVTSGRRAGSVELVNSSGLVGTFDDRDQAYAEVRRLRGETGYGFVVAALNRNPHELSSVGEAMRRGLEDGCAYLAHYSSHEAQRILRDARASWRRAEVDHAEVSYYGAENIRKSRAYFIGAAWTVHRKAGRALEAVPA